MLEPIPGPPGYPILGNIFDIRDEVPVNGLVHLADKYGPIYKVNLYGQEFVVVSSVRMLEELSDETRFHKVLSPGLASIQQSKASGLFVAPSEDDADWGQAHRVLMPSFGPLAITEMFDDMYDIASQLVLKWARTEDRIQATEDFTRLTLDTIALCAMDYRFNSFYRTDMHPFVQAMSRNLGAGNGPSSIYGVLRLLAGRGQNENIKKDRAFMESISNELIQHRRKNPCDKRDLLNAMISNRDPRTGEVMRDDLITANMTTFLIAGHETTSGLLSFALAYLLKTPSALRSAQAEIDRVIGQEKPTAKLLNDLVYLNAVLRETLRLNPTVPAFMRQVRPEYHEPITSLGGYSLNRDTKVYALIAKSGRDPEVFGENANQFCPERMLDGKFEKLPKSAWKPFGTGPRACIGRAFAWQEALLALALLLQSFDVKLDDPSYEIHVKQTLTVKPRDLYVRVTPRKGRDIASIQKATLSGNQTPSNENIIPNGHKEGENDRSMPELLVLFGSNTGTCQTLAQRLAADASNHGHNAKVLDLDSGITDVESGTKTVVIVTASYEGQPPDNAAHFVEWINSKDKHLTLSSLDYSVFGCGHSDWASTFLRIPTLIDQKLGEFEANRVTHMGHSDAAKDDIFGDFDNWADTEFWPAMQKLKGHTSVENVTSKLEIEIRNQDRAIQLRQDIKAAIVEQTRLLTSPGEPAKYHLEILLPSGLTYEPGDYLTVLSLNPDSSIQRVMARYHIPWDATIVVKSGSTVLPIDTPITIASLLKGYVELAQPATKKDVRKLLEYATDQTATAALQSYLGGCFESEILAKRSSILDILNAHHGVDLPFSEFLSLLPPMRTRYYSISSSPLVDPSRCTITCAIVDAPSRSGVGRFSGVAGSYLKSLQPGDSIQVAIRSTSSSFRLPLQPEKTPLIMFCAGTGLAPFRGFVQHRAELMKAGNKRLAPALLFVGCRSATHDRLYAEEFDEWVKLGAVEVRYAFSHEENDPRSEGCKHVQDRMLRARNDMEAFWERGAKIYICGNPEMAKAVTAVAKLLTTDKLAAEGKEVADEKLKEWFLQQKGERFVTDIFA